MTALEELLSKTKYIYVLGTDKTANCLTTDANETQTAYFKIIKYWQSQDCRESAIYNTITI